MPCQQLSIRVPVQVLIENRDGPVRNILNVKELLQDCNNGTGWRLPPASPIKRVQCR